MRKNKLYAAFMISCIACGCTCSENSGDDHNGDIAVETRQRINHLSIYFSSQKIQTRMDAGLIDNTKFIDSLSDLDVRSFVDMNILHNGEMIDAWGEDILMWLSDDKKVVAIASKGPNKTWDNAEKDDYVMWSYTYRSGTSTVKEDEKFSLSMDSKND